MSPEVVSGDHPETKIVPGDHPETNFVSGHHPAESENLSQNCPSEIPRDKFCPSGRQCDKFCLPFRAPKLVSKLFPETIRRQNLSPDTILRNPIRRRRIVSKCPVPLSPETRHPSLPSLSSRPLTKGKAQCTHCREGARHWSARPRYSGWAWAPAWATA